MQVSTWMHPVVSQTQSKPLIYHDTSAWLTQDGPKICSTLFYRGNENWPALLGFNNCHSVSAFGGFLDSRSRWLERKLDAAESGFARISIGRLVVKCAEGPCATVHLLVMIKRSNCSFTASLGSFLLIYNPSTQRAFSIQFMQLVLTTSSSAMSKRLPS